VKIWLNAGSKEALTDAVFTGEQVLIDLFIKCNTVIHSIAPVERLFSIGKDILTARRAYLVKLSDANFEKLMFMKGSGVVTRVRVRLKSRLESDFAGLGLGLRTKRLGLGLRLGSVGLGLELRLELEHVTNDCESKSWTTHQFRICSDSETVGKTELVK
jgi:hypothetical protein